MVNVTITDGIATFELKGLHKLWAFKRKIQIPVSSIKNVKKDPTAMKGIWKGLRFPGTHIPGIIVAGTFRSKGEKHFWNVTNKEKTIVIDIEGGHYDKVIVDVNNPETVVSDLLSAQK
ncbi:MAG: hypothetical protein HOB40_10150 [Candidatus Marinimicrobia bacterium]|jgi:hypothetical protein|nr:hypothetical protein [Candidatus Neomarinimicrobiota bacterium]MBT3840157.1 hypothetical protein [Candidatus Neomarinimicrobiota bacterium]MBT3999151.1 hypothetical protein [Candidatus Neomarinimicrobiota bacterium]MBT4282587.1 hypothetical protein [Candidatus Neomarinimicrobiota bacterium]MBT4579683.1 hypothetical protein [Candidatus Neomarinimicrobiota bacterium]